MTLTETLERLAVVAPEFIEHYPEYYEFLMQGPVPIRFGESKTGRLVEVMPGYGRDVEWDIFGACCEKVKAEGWIWLKQARNVQVVDPDDNYRIIADSRLDDGLTDTLASALLAALEGRLEKCPACEGRKKERMFQREEDGMKTIIQDCPECQGSGEKQEVQA